MKQQSNFQEELFNTLAQFRTGQKPYLLHGNGSDLNNKKRQLLRSKRKFLDQFTMLKLVDHAKHLGDTDWVDKYWDVYHCHTKIKVAASRIHGAYCKLQFCHLCSTNRKAELVNKYLPILSKWPKPYLLTLTVKSVPMGELNKRVEKVLKVLNLIYDMFRKRHQRDSKKKKIMFVRSLECNFNPVSSTYNPHFHLITPDEATANLLMQEWLKYMKFELAYSIAQDKSKIWNLEKGLIEVLKYATKGFTEENPDLKRDKNKKRPKQPHYLFIAAMHEINKAMAGRRLFSTMGFRLPAGYKKAKTKPSVVLSCKEYTFDLLQNDYVDDVTDEVLTGYKTSAELNDLINNRVDVNSH